MAVTKKESLRDVLQACRDHGVKKISFDGYAIEFESDQPVIIPKSSPIGEAAGNPTEDELLYWSTPEGMQAQAVPINKL